MLNSSNQQNRNICDDKNIPIKRALISVSNKQNLLKLAQALHAKQIEIISTGGTATYLTQQQIPVTLVESLTNFPEIMDGRVKTLHPAIHGGLLALRDNDTHQLALQQHNIIPIDLLIVNLYPFEQMLTSNESENILIENIDIGGPAMIRAAAKNHLYTTVITCPDSYDKLIEHLDSNDKQTTLSFRQKLAAEAFKHVSEYDSQIAGWMSKQYLTDEPLPSKFSITGKRKAIMRYGENPHQIAALYQTDFAGPNLCNATQHQGKELSYNNINDTDAAFQLIAEFDHNIPTAAILKHANPCGVAQADNLVNAYKKALECDPISAFGGIIALNQTIDAATANEITKIFTEVIIAPDASDEAKAILARKKNLRLLTTGGLPTIFSGLTYKAINGGFLVQSVDNLTSQDLELKVVTKRAPSPQELADLVFAFQVAKHVKSNAIIYAKDLATVGIGAGQMSRLDSAYIAANKANIAAQHANKASSLTLGSVVASDAFFPFADGLLTAIEAGATAAIQPGGSMRDQEVIDAADEHNIAMVFTGVRHFKH